MRHEKMRNSHSIPWMFAILLGRFLRLLNDKPRIFVAVALNVFLVRFNEAERAGEKFLRLAGGRETGTRRSKKSPDEAQLGRLIDFRASKHFSTWPSTASRTSKYENEEPRTRAARRIFYEDEANWNSAHFSKHLIGCPLPHWQARKNQKSEK